MLGTALYVYVIKQGWFRRSRKARVNGTKGETNQDSEK